MTAVAPVLGLFETHLTVRDLDRAVAFYQDIVGLELAHRVPERHAAFLWIGGRGRHMLGLWEIHTAPIFMRLHIAFSATLPDVEASVARLRQAGIPPRSSGGGPEIDEPIVYGWMPAASVFFDDPDGHSIEFISMLPEPARPERGILSLSAWRQLEPPPPAPR
jgi:catechol 2,3-dioxygenase-like lactoylglutathione lyase family enzyme